MFPVQILSKCPECNSPVSQRGSEIICNRCGLIIADSIPDDSRYPSQGERKPERVPLITSRRLRNAQRRVNKTSDRNMAFALAYIRRLSESLYLSRNASIEAIKFYRKAFSMGIIKGKNIEIVASALIYAVSRQLGVPRTVKEVCAVNGMGRRDVFRMYKALSRKLKLKCPICKPESYLFRFANIMGLSEKVKSRALEILSKAPRDGNRSPTTLAAAALYIAGLENSEHKSFKKASKLLGVGEACIRDAVPVLAEKAGIQLGSEQIMQGIKRMKMAPRYVSLDKRLFLKEAGSKLFSFTIPK